MRTLTDGSRVARAFLVGDLCGVVAFLVVGLDRHGEDDAARFFALAAIFVSAWLVVGWVVGTYRPPSNGRLLLTLALAVPLAVVLRVWLVQFTDLGATVTFAVVALVFATLFVGIARVLVSLVARGQGWT
jgi:Protein of unknown function (DUF3054)